jgi:hypothetical protein
LRKLRLEPGFRFFPLATVSTSPASASAADGVCAPLAMPFGAKPAKPADFCRIYTAGPVG